MMVTVHPTEMCNQSCKYCVTHKGTKTMSDDTLINSIDFISHLQPCKESSYVGFFSAEPTLRGLPFFIRAEELMVDFGINMHRMLATNTTTNEWQNNMGEWLNFLHTNDWLMNISLDGPEYIHDRNRGAGSWREVIDSLIHIKEHNIQYGIISVIMNGSDLNPVYDFFVDINEPVQLNPTLPFNDMNEELCALFDRWLIDHKPINIHPFNNIFNYFTNQRYTSECPTICTHDLASIAPNGDVRPCEYFWDNTDMKDLYVYGNVNTDSFDDIWHGEVRQRMLDYVNNTPEDCKTCPWINFCGTGCSYAKHVGADKCSYVKELLEHASWLGDRI